LIWVACIAGVLIVGLIVAIPVVFRDPPPRSGNPFFD
jgi:hypothetical protein